VTGRLESALRASWWPFLAAFDLLGDEDKPDHGKIATSGLLIYYCAVNFLRGPDKLPSVTVTLILFSAAFGARVYMGFLRSQVAREVIRAGPPPPPESIPTAYTRDDERGS
jgi:hypothetical protein